MITIVSRKFRSSPYREAIQTWDAITALLLNNKQTVAKQTLESVAGIAASCIADQFLKNHPIVITCDGPRTKIYCLYDDDALDDMASEEPLVFDPLQGDWKIFLPCTKDTLAWIQPALTSLTKNIFAYDTDIGMPNESKTSPVPSVELTINQKEFLKP